MRDSHPTPYCTETWYDFYISGLQKTLAPLFNLVWHTQKTKWAFSFECPDKVFLSIEKVLEKISED